MGHVICMPDENWIKNVQNLKRRDHFARVCVGEIWEWIGFFLKHVSHEGVDWIQVVQHSVYVNTVMNLLAS
jgi:hypothetical protein